MSLFDFRVSSTNLEMCVLSVSGSLQVKMFSGTGSSGCFSFLAFFQAAKLTKSHAPCTLVCIGLNYTL